MTGTFPCNGLGDYEERFRVHSLDRPLQAGEKAGGKTQRRQAAESGLRLCFADLPL